MRHDERLPGWNRGRSGWASRYNSREHNLDKVDSRKDRLLRSSKAENQDQGGSRKDQQARAGGDHSYPGLPGNGTRFDYRPNSGGPSTNPVDHCHIGGIHWLAEIQPAGWYPSLAGLHPGGA